MQTRDQINNYKQIITLSFIIALFLAHAYYLDSLFLGNCYDDAYISFRYAKNLSEGHGLSFNKGETVEGYTNLVWVLANAAAYRFGIAPEKFSKVAGYLFGLLCIMMVFLLRSTDGNQKARAAWWAPLLLAAGAALPAASVSGLETAAWLACILGALLFFNRFCKNGGVENLIGAGASLALVVLLRADGFVIPAIILTIAILLHRNRFNRLREWLLLFGPPAACIAGMFIFRFLYFGQWLPNTYYAKVDIGLVNRIASGGSYLLALIVAYALYAALILVPSRNRLSLISRKTYIPFAGLYALYLFSVGGDLPYLFRLALPVLVCLYLAMADALFAENRAGNAKPFTGSRLFTAVFVVLTALSSFLAGEDLRLHRVLAAVDRDQIALGHWLAEHVPPNTTIAVQAAGQIPYYSQLKTIDLYGLTDPDVRNWPIVEGPHGHRRFNRTLIADHRPQIIAAYCEKILAGSGIASEYVTVAPLALPGISFCARRDYLEFIDGILVEP